MKANDEVQQKEKLADEGKLPLRTSRITKGIKRTLNTAAYETIVIEDSIEEEITWKTKEERDLKVENWEKVLIESFKKSHDKILDELGLSHKKAYFKKVSEETAKRYVQEPVKKNLDDLDALDIG